MQCLDFPAALAAMALVSSLLKTSEIMRSRATYKVRPVAEGAGKRHELGIMLRGDPARPEECRKYLVELMPEVAAMAVQRSGTSPQKPAAASLPEHLTEGRSSS